MTRRLGRNNERQGVLQAVSPLVMMAALFPAGQLAAQVSRDLLDYLRNPTVAPVLEWAEPDRVVVNGAKAPVPTPVVAAVETVAVKPAIPEPVVVTLDQPDLAKLTPTAPLTAPGTMAALALPPLDDLQLAALAPAALQDMAPDAPPPPIGQKIPLMPLADGTMPVEIAPEGKALYAGIQELMKELNCYSGSVDGSFGPGSLGALDAFYDANGLPPVTEASAQAWRDLRAYTAKACPEPYKKKADPVVKAAAAPKPPKAQGTTKAATPKPAAAPKPAAPKPAKPATKSMSDLAADAN